MKKANLLFIDNPVGTGFSYVTNDSAYATTNKQIAVDLVSTLTHILETVPEFQVKTLITFNLNIVFTFISFHVIKLADQQQLSFLNLMKKIIILLLVVYSLITLVSSLLTLVT